MRGGLFGGPPPEMLYGFRLRLSTADQRVRVTTPDSIDTHDSRECFDFIVVSSGAGGSPLAANLAEAGFRVLLPEAGGDYQCAYCDVPIMQARASEDADMRWDFFVRHYGGDAAQRRDQRPRHDLSAQQRLGSHRRTDRRRELARRP